MTAAAIAPCDALTIRGTACASRGERALWSEGVRHIVCTRHANAAHAGDVVRFPQRDNGGNVAREWVESERAKGGAE